MCNFNRSNIIRIQFIDQQWYNILVYMSIYLIVKIISD